MVFPDFILLAVRDHIQVMKVKVARVIHFALKWFAVKTRPSDLR